MIFLFDSIYDSTLVSTSIHFISHKCSPLYVYSSSRWLSATLRGLISNAIVLWSYLSCVCCLSLLTWRPGVECVGLEFPCTANLVKRNGQMCVCLWQLEMGCFEELDLTKHLVTPLAHLPKITCMLSGQPLSWPLALGSFCVCLHSSFLEKGKGEERRNFLICREGRDERPPHSELAWKTARKSERGRADGIFSSEERSDRPCVYTGVLRAKQIELCVSQNLTINIAVHIHICTSKHKMHKTQKLNLTLK